MVKVEKLGTKNSNAFNELLEEAREDFSFRYDYHTYYNNKTFLSKFLIRKSVKLIKLNDQYIGYLWCEIPSDKSIHIKDAFIKKEYISELDSSFLKSLNYNNVVYETYEDRDSLSMLGNLEMKKVRTTNVLQKPTSDIVYFDCLDDISFRKYNKGKDAKIRCKIQNEIFKGEGRVPLSLDDIIYDERQDYFLEDLCVFILKNKKIIGYGQIIYSRCMYSIVNFGIIEGYRGLGYGFSLINKLIDLGMKKNIEKLYVRVENNNILAKKLYHKVGFKGVGDISTWVWKKTYFNVEDKILEYK